MPWCPKCRRFQEDDDLCAYCWVETVDQLEPETQVPEEDHEVLLLTVADENEANIVQTLLKTNNIPSLRKHRGSGGYLQVYMGMANFGIDIFVSKSEFEQARDILTGNSDDIVKTDNCMKEEKAGEDLRDDDMYSTRRRNRLIIILAIFFIINLITIVILSVKFNVSIG